MGLEYSRRLYANVMDWYRIADSKGQLLLTLDGVLVTIVTGIVLGQPAEVSKRLGQFGALPLVPLGTGQRVDPTPHPALRRRPETEETYTAQVAWWFGMIAVLEPQNIYSLIKQANEEFERDALASVFRAPGQLEVMHT
jgi:hypothetical protein